MLRCLSSMTVAANLAMWWATSSHFASTFAFASTTGESNLRTVQLLFLFAPRFLASGERRYPDSRDENRGDIYDIVVIRGICVSQARMYAF